MMKCKINDGFYCGMGTSCTIIIAKIVSKLLYMVQKSEIYRVLLIPFLKLFYQVPSLKSIYFILTNTLKCNVVELYKSFSDFCSVSIIFHPS